MSSDQPRYYLIRPGDIARAVRSIVPNFVFNPQVKRFVTNPYTAVVTIVVLFFYNTFIRPVFRGILAVGQRVVNAVFALFDVVGSIIPTVLGAFGAVFQSATSLIAAVRAFNSSIVAEAITIGLPGPPLLIGVWVGETLVVAWASAFVVRRLFEILQIEGVLNAVVEPPKAVIGTLLEVMR